MIVSVDVVSCNDFFSVIYDVGLKMNVMRMIE